MNACFEVDVKYFVVRQKIMMWGMFGGEILLRNNVFLLLTFMIIYKILFVLDAQSFNHTDMSFVDCLYFATCTQSTVGFGEYHPMKPVSKIVVTVHIMLTIYLNLIRPIAAAKVRT